MRLEVHRLDHDPVGFARFAYQFNEDAVEHTQTAPADEPVVDRLMRAAGLGRIAPHQAMLDHIDDRRDDPAIINPWHPMRQREKSSIRRTCASLSKTRHPSTAPP
jgi:hypothetical protein